MKQETKSKIAKVLGVAAVGVIGMGAGAMLFPTEHVVPDAKVVAELAVAKEKISQLESAPAQIVKELVEVPVEKIVTETVEVPVDNGNLEVVLDHIFDNKGKVEYLTDGLKEAEVSEIVDRIVFINDVKALAVGAVENDGKEELDKEKFSNANVSITFDEDDVDRFRVEDDAEDVIVDDIDFDDGDAEAFVTVRVEQDDKEFDVVYKVIFKDGEVDDLKVDSISQ